MREEKIGSKISQKISFSPVFLPANVLSSLSLPAASSALGDPTETFLLHKQTAPQPPHKPKSSPAIGAATARSSLSPLQIFFFCFFFFLPPPLNTPQKSFSCTNRRFSSGREATASLSSPSSPPSPLCKFLHFLPLPAAAAPANTTTVFTADFRSSSPPASHHHHTRWSASLASPSSSRSTVFNSGS